MWRNRFQKHFWIVGNGADGQAAHCNKEKQQIFIAKTYSQATLITNSSKLIINFKGFLFHWLNLDRINFL